jgi:hypothetical protein
MFRIGVGRGTEIGFLNRGVGANALGRIGRNDLPVDED